MNTFGSLSDQFNWLLKINPFYYAPAIGPLVFHQLTWWHPLVLVAAGLVFGIAGLLIFNRRDLPAVCFLTAMANVLSTIIHAFGLQFKAGESPWLYGLDGDA